ncbi:hypothetical protein Cgig2_034019 [Carnegiea gigantea]|uniref:Uncharacterized protein n=1 Tax=Carnegiea gigantea TaxID=171969 RepID=A0A9Q1GS18_9CARY|nr:hypothetical protein Cgig2_034019 [Carnegiea gigantea]
MARYRKKGGKRNHKYANDKRYKCRKVWSKKVQGKERKKPRFAWKRKVNEEHEQKGKSKDIQVKFSQESHQQKADFIQGEVNSEFEDWLRRSIVCTSKEPRDLATLALAVICGFGQCTKNLCFKQLQIYFNPTHYTTDGRNTELSRRIKGKSKASYSCFLKTQGTGLSSRGLVLLPKQGNHGFQRYGPRFEDLKDETITKNKKAQSLHGQESPVFKKNAQSLPNEPNPPQLQPLEEGEIYISHSSQEAPPGFERIGYANISKRTAKQSEEVPKLSQHLQALEDVSQPPTPGFENEGMNDKNHLETGCILKTLEHEVSPFKDGYCGVQQSEEIKPPPGFEKIAGLNEPPSKNSFEETT